MKKVKPNKVKGFDGRPKTQFLDYFGRERKIHMWLREKRTRMAAVVYPVFVRLGLVPDTISYIGICLLAGVVFYFIRQPGLAVAFLAGHVICDGLDGAYARHTGKASQGGAFTDLVCDQLGMVVVAMLVLFHHFVPPLLGAVYVVLYLIVVVFGVILNVMGLGTRITITSKYFLYLVYAGWAFWRVNWFAELMSFFSVIMVIEVIVGYFRLKRGIRRKYDAEKRFTEDDQYTSRLNYALNAAVPITVLLTILIGANVIPLRSFFDAPGRSVAWQKGLKLPIEAGSGNILGFGVYGSSFLTMSPGRDGALRIAERSLVTGRPGRVLSLPDYLNPSATGLPTEGTSLLIADKTTNLLLAVDLEASFDAGSAVAVMMLPLGHLRVTAMTVTMLGGKRVWLADNYLYTRKTYVIDPDKAQTAGALPGGITNGFVNGAFPSGTVVRKGRVIALNRSRLNSLLYVAPLDKLLNGSDILEAAECSFLPPCRHCIGPVIVNNRLYMISPSGQLYFVPLDQIVDNGAGTELPQS